MTEATPPPRRAAFEAANTLRTAILRGSYPPGTDLPGERELSTRLGVNRLTLRQALARLEAEGLVKPVHGSGTRVLDYTETGGIELVGYLVALGQQGGASSLKLLESLLELRLTLAVEVVGMAAERATDEELASLNALVDRQSERTDDPATYVKGDLTISRKIVRATHNLPLVLMANTVINQLEQQPGIEIVFLLDPMATLAFYRRVLNRMAARDVKGARSLTRRIMARLDRFILSQLAGAGGDAQSTPTDAESAR